jgi:EAL domain-containing protein (putative c-di-GMP-specific phosphodiesterase class I)
VIQKIYIIDDDPDITCLLVSYAEINNIATNSANSWAQVDMKILKQADLIILDLAMPDFDGLDILELLALEGVTVPISFCSGQDDNVIDTAADLLKSHGLLYAGKMLKPFSLQVFSKLIGLVSIIRPENVPVAIDNYPPSLMAIDKTTFIRAINENWFTVLYQPQVLTQNNTLFGLECLARLNIPGEKTIMPDVFIPALSAYELMDDFTLKIFQLGLSTLENLSLPQDLKISFNLSTSSVSESFLAKLITCCKQYKFPAHNIVLEITETATLDISQQTKKLLTKLRLQGFGLSLDDFGTGYGTIQEIDSLPFNEIKIDKIFVQSMHDKKTSMAIVSSTIELADKLSFMVIAEGVETQQQAETLAALNCPVSQGYFYSKPLSKERLVNYLG